MTSAQDVETRVTTNGRSQYSFHLDDQIPVKFDNNAVHLRKLYVSRVFHRSTPKRERERGANSPSLLLGREMKDLGNEVAFKPVCFCVICLT